MDHDNDDRSPLGTFVQTFAYLLGVSLASYLSVEIVRRYHSHADRALDSIDAEGRRVAAQVRDRVRVWRQVRREGRYVVFEAMTVARDASTSAEGER